MKTTMLARWAILATLAAQAGAAHAIDLVGAYEQALRHDPEQLAANSAVVAGRESAVQGDALLRPRVALQAGVNRIDDHMSGSVPSSIAALVPSHSSGTVRQASIEITQPIYDAGAGAERRQLKQQASLAETEFDQARQDLAQRVAAAYFGVISSQESLRVTLAEKAAIAMQLERAQARFDVGRGKITDVEEARARYDQIQTKEINARNVAELRRAQFKETTGASPDELSGLAAGFAASPPDPDSLQSWQERGEAQSNFVKERQASLAIASAEVDKHRLSGRPTLNAVASYSPRGQSGSLSPIGYPSSDRTGLVGLQFNMPLYAGGGMDSRERQSLARREEAEQELAAAQRDVRLQVQDAYLAVRMGVSRIASSEQSLISARSALDATTLGRDVGTRTELDVLDAQQRAFAAEFDVVQARLDYLMGRIRLSAAVGELGEEQLRTLGAWLSAP